MKKFLMMFLFSAFIFTGVGFAQAPPPAPVVVAPVHHMRHPEIHRAMHKLRDAKQDLEKAADDYGGHKDRAIEAIDHALGELQSALDYAASH